MSSRTWWTTKVRTSELLANRPQLAEMVRDLRGKADAGAPGRTAALVSERVRQMVTGRGSMESFGRLDPAEQAVVDVTEQFLIDAHGVDDSLMARLGEHYTPAEQVAIMFHLALADGFTKFQHVFGADDDDPAASATPEEER
jgi:hypothetical protein